VCDWSCIVDYTFAPIVFNVKFVYFRRNDSYLENTVCALEVVDQFRYCENSLQFHLQEGSQTMCVVAFILFEFEQLVVRCI
jgi:hypothetical protein